MSEHSRTATAGFPLLQRLLGLRGKGAPAENGPSSPIDTSTADGVRQGLDAVEKRLARLDRELFKGRALSEAQIEQFASALESLRAADARREAELEELRSRSQADRQEARLEVAQALLPVLDGLDEGLRSGRRLLEQHADPSHPSTLLARLFTRPVPRESKELREALAAWLAGLTFVRQRLLDVLAGEGVQPIAAEGRPFDPHYHVAVEIVPVAGDVPAGTVSSEVRRGYLVGDRVLRYAEVAVVGETGA